MATTVYIPVEEYLSTSYRPDCDYVDGEVLERNLGTQSHALLQALLAKWFDDRFESHGCVGLTEQRLRVDERRVRIPDVCALVNGADEEVLTSAPLVCIEVLSPEDTLTSLQERVSDYVRLGVPNIWIFDPVKQRSWTVTSDGAIHPFTEDMLQVLGTTMSMSVPEMFASFTRRRHRIR